MPNLKTHQCVGTAAGALYAAYLANGQANSNWLIEVAGGALGGYVGGSLPDLFEPATTPRHRDVCHSWVAGSTVVSHRETLVQAAQFCRQRAVEATAKRLAVDPQTGVYVEVPVDPVADLVSRFAEIIWKFLAGFLNGLAAGYTSHLALDAFTPRGLPWVTASGHGSLHLTNL